MDRVELVGRFLARSEFCPAVDGADDGPPWPPPGTWCAASGNRHSCQTCITAWLKQPEPEKPVKAGSVASKDGEWRTGRGCITLSRKSNGDLVLNLQYANQEIELDTPAVVALAQALRCVPVPAKMTVDEWLRTSTIPRKSRA